MKISNLPCYQEIKALVIILTNCIICSLKLQKLKERILTSILLIKTRQTEKEDLVMIKIRKSFLATASLLAITTGLNTNTIAANLVKSDGGGAILLQNAVVPVNTNSVAPWLPDDSLALDHSEAIRTGGIGATISVIDLNGNDSTLRISANSSLASVINSAGGNEKLQVTVDDTFNFTIGGQDGLKHDGTAQAAGILTALSKIQLGSAAGNGTLTINDSVRLPTSIDSSVDHSGTINILPDKRAIFEEAIGSIAIIDQLNLLGNNSRAILKKNSSIDQVELHHNRARLILDDDTTLTGNVDSNGNGGRLILRGNNEITGTIGLNAPLSHIIVNGKSPGGNTSVLHNIVRTNLLDIKNNDTLISKTNSIANTNRINIGNDGTLSIDTNGNYNINGGHGITFDGQDSTIELTNTSHNNSIVTLQNSLLPGATPDANGILKLNATGAMLSLDQGINKTIGIDNTHRLNNFIIDGSKNIVIDTNTFAKTISIGSTGDVIFNKDIDSGANSIIKFDNAGNTTFIGNVSAETIDFGNHARIVTLDGTINTQNIISTTGHGSQISLVGNSNLNLLMPGIVVVDRIFAGEAGATANLGTGQYNVDDIQIIDGAGTVEIGDETMITGGFNNLGGAPGNIIFKGNATVMENLGNTTSPIGAVTIGGVNKKLNLSSDVHVTSLDASNVNDQYLEFNNFNDINIQGNIGHTEPFNEIRFGGSGIITFGAGSLQTGQDLFFNANNQVVTNNYDLGNTNINNTTILNKLTVNVNQHITGRVGANNNFFGELHVDSPTRRDVIIDSNQFFAGITGANAHVTLNKDGVSIPYLGQNTDPIKYTNFTDNGEVLGAVYVENIDIQDGKTAKFNHNIFNAELEMHGANAIAEFNNNVTINSPINGIGILNFHNGAIINDNLGTIAQKLSQVRFNGDTVIDSNIHSNEIRFNNCNLTLNNNTEFDGQTTFDNTVITLNNDLVMKNGDVELIGAVVINTSFDGTNVNSITASTGSNIKLADPDTLLINIDDSNNISSGGAIVKPLVTDTTGKLSLDISKVTISSTSSTSNWVASLNGDELVLTQTSDTSSDIPTQKPINEVQKENKSPVPKNTNDADNARLESIFKKVTSSVNRVANVSMKITGQAEKSILRRTNGNQFNRQVSVATANNDNIIGISSGDTPEKYGIWGNTFYSKSMQKERIGNAGYKSYSYGGTLGFDTKISDDSLIGFALSVTNTNIKHKNLNAGDKTDITSYLLSAYANQAFSRNWFGQGVISIGSSKINHKDIRSIGASTQIATSNYNSTILSTEAILGYNNTFSNKSTITPMFGLSYYGISSQAYKETGPSSIQLLNIGKMSSHKLDAIVGAKFTTSSMRTSSLVITPEAHAFINHDLIGKNQNVTAQLNGTRVQTPKTKLQRTFYNLGGSLNIEHGATDYVLSIDTNLAPKYTGVQGSLKVRINF